MFKCKIGEKQYKICKEAHEQVKQNYVSKDIIKGKIEELEILISECVYLDNDDEVYKEAVEKDILCYIMQRNVLKELLESEV